MALIDFALRGDFIPLDALLKATGQASSGGMAKQMIGAGMVLVDGKIELRRSCKLRPGQTIEYGACRVRIIAGAASVASSSNPDAIPLDDQNA